MPIAPSTSQWHPNANSFRRAVQTLASSNSEVSLHQEPLDTTPNDSRIQCRECGQSSRGHLGNPRCNFCERIRLQIVAEWANADSRNTSAGDGGVLAPTPMGPRREPSTPLYLTQESEAPSRDEALASCRLPPQAGHYPMCRPPTCSCTEQTAVPTMGTDPHGTSAAKSAASPSTSPLVRRRSSSSSSSSSRSTPAAARLKKTKTLEDSSTLEDSRTPEDNQLLAIQDSSTLEVELPVIGDFSKASASRCQQVFSSHCH